MVVVVDAVESGSHQQLAMYILLPIIRSYYIDSHPLQNLTHRKDLGINFSANLTGDFTWNLYVQQPINNLA